MSYTLRVCALYPELMNIYADRGNLLMLQRRCQWRGIAFELAEASLGDELDPHAHDLVYLGGGQDRDQLLCAKDLVQVKGDALRHAAAQGVQMLGVCGGYQLLGRSYELGPDESIEGLGLLDVETVRPQGSSSRLIGNVAIEMDLEEPPLRVGLGGLRDRGTRPAREDHGSLVLAGFENHGGRTRLLSGQAPLGKVLRGFGNDGQSGFEGAISGSVIGTYLHGPLLPKNAFFADWLISAALRIPPSELAPLDDTLEQQAHASALRAAGL
ncbi:MAG TPA: glutamine amidotransferase [Solirubrobacteraceae bacterium]|jgi:hypothetical protein